MSNTQSNSSNNTKIVLYYGKEFQVPQAAKWIHTDYDGDVYWSNKKLISLAYIVQDGVEYGCVGSFNHTEMSTINWMLSQKRIQDLPSVSSGLESEPEQKAHPHADLMLKYAQIAQYSDKPWEELQFKGFDGTWLNCTHQPQFKPERQYRLKPQTVEPVIQVGQVWEHSVGVRFVVSSVVQAQYLKDIHVTLALELHEQSKVIHRVTATELQQHFTLVK